MKFILFAIPGLLLSENIVETKLNPYKSYLEWGTYEGQAWPASQELPKSRYETFKAAFEVLPSNPVVVELGTSRSFVHGGHPGCNLDDPRFWFPQQPENWDWGAGFFTRMAAMSLSHLSPEIHTVDLSREHLERCRVITQDFSNISYHVCSSEDYLNSCYFPNGIDLLYLDTGDMTPIEQTALLQLREAQIIVRRNLIAKNGLILIDDVRNQTPKKFGEQSDLAKAKYSLEYLLNHGFEMIMDGYQVLLRKKG